MPARTTRADYEVPSDPIPARIARSLEPLDLLALVVTFGALVVVIGPIDDINDLFWHVLIGQQILDGTPIADLGSGFSYSTDNPAWRTGAWASEALFAGLYGLGDWPMVLSVIRLGSILGIAGVLWWHVLRRFPSRASVPPFVLAMAVVATTVQERPQSLSFIGIALAGGWWFASVARNQPPRWWVVGIVSIAWANLHGLWVVLPAVLLLALAGRFLDHGRQDPYLRPLAFGVLASVLGGLLTPIGIDSWLLPLRLQAAGGIIIEWQRTELIAWPGYALMIVAGLCLFLVGRCRTRSWILYTVVVSVFGLSAIRNVTPAVLLLTPLLAALLEKHLEHRAKSSVTPPERRALWRVSLAMMVAGSILVGATLITRDHGPPDDLPVSALSALGRSGESVRLLNEYNWAGMALFYGPEGLRVGIDGRADYYGGDFIRRYERALDGVGLDELVADLEPTHALLRQDTPAVDLLEFDGWSVQAEDDHFVLLQAP